MQGLAWVNGFNLGWYWPAAGPQMTTFVPGPLLRAGGNDVVLLEFLCAPTDEAGADELAATKAGWYQVLVTQFSYISEKDCLQFQTQAYTSLCQDTGPVVVRSLNQPHAN